MLSFLAVRFQVNDEVRLEGWGGQAGVGVEGDASWVVGLGESSSSGG